MSVVGKLLSTAFQRHQFRWILSSIDRPTALAKRCYADVTCNPCVLSFLYWPQVPTTSNCSLPAGGKWAAWHHNGHVIIYSRHACDIFSFCHACAMAMVLSQRQCAHGACRTVFLRDFRSPRNMWAVGSDAQFHPQSRAPVCLAHPIETTWSQSSLSSLGVIFS